MNEAMKIRKGVPLPPDQRGPRLAYPWDKMEVGDVYPAPSFPPADKRAAPSALSYGKRHGKVFTTRRDGDGVRIWRVE